MPNIYGSGGAKSAFLPVYKPPPLPGSGGGFTPPDSDSDLDAGKFTIDLTDPIGSVGESIGSAVEFGSGLVGGVAGAIGSIGPDADTASVGQLVEDLGRIPGGIGELVAELGVLSDRRDVRLLNLDERGHADQRGILAERSAQ